MNFTLEQKTRILELTLQGKTDKEISRLIPDKKLTEGKLRYSRTYNAIPKRKKVLGFICLNFIQRLGTKLLLDSVKLVTGDMLRDKLNEYNVKSPTNKTWKTDSVKRYLESFGITSNTNRYSASKISELITYTLDDITEYDHTLDPESFIPVIEDFDFELEAKKKEVNVVVDKRMKQLKEAIEEALIDGAETVSAVTDHLNKLNLKNRAGKKFSRWSVKLLMQDLNLECHRKIPAKQYSRIMEDWIMTYPPHKHISRETFNKKLNSLAENEKILITKSNVLYSELGLLISNHNMEYRLRKRGEEYREKVEFVVFKKYKHRPITAAEMGRELGVSSMQGNRIMRDYLRIEPFDIWFENLYNLVKPFVTSNSRFKIEELALHLNKSYLTTQRGNDWDFTNTNLTYIRLQERYPDLPNSTGRRP